ncbi:uncharacterized protein LOC107360586 [Tetranychus urticae]|uniref:MICOS complex subunit n=1 Tax=Tetranychus urticae TaxID=32264 RepID=T1K4Z9_TETUR|nr:uncharacterized protein LOC107360586 [Tetranychus urticae]
MAISLKTVFLLSILVINLQQLESAKLHIRNEPVSPCCQPSFLMNLFSYSPCACPPPPTALPPPVKKEPVKVEHTTPNYPVSTVPPKEYHVSPCGPPQCYVDPAKQTAELAKIFNEGSSKILKYTSTATGPIIYAAEAINSGADLIPMAFAASGDFLGKAISGPIKLFSKLGFGFLTGAISQIISIPITFGTSVQASVINVQPYLERIMSIGSNCCPQTTQAPLFSSGIEQIALKPIGILAGASHIALGKMLNIGGTTFKLIGTMTRFGGELAETAGYGMKNNGAIKVADGVNSIASFLKKLETPSSVICVVGDDKVGFYEPIDEKKKEKDEKTGKEKPITVTESYKPTTSAYVPTTTAKYIVPVTTPYSTTTTTVKYIPPVTTPYATTTTAVKYTTAYVPPKIEKPTTTTMVPFFPDAYDSSVNIPDVPEGSSLSDGYHPNPEEEEKDDD